MSDRRDNPQDRPSKRPEDAAAAAEAADAAARHERSARRAKHRYEPVFKSVVKREHRGSRRTWQERHAEQAAIDAERADERSHWRAVLHRQVRHRGRDTIAVLLLLIAGIGTGLVILSQQNTSLPGWVPVFGDDFYEIEAELTSAQGVTPGQGQAVMMSGIQVGLIDSVHLEDGVAVVGLNIEPKYGSIVRSDASMLLRPRTGLNDMTVEVDPGSPEQPPLEEGGRITVAETAPNVNPDEFLATLDADTRAYLKLLLEAGAKGLDGRGEQLSAGFRRFEPFTRFIARFNGAIAKRREALAGAIHNFQRLTVELGRNADAIEDFVASSAGALEGFANSQDAIRESLAELPATLTTTREALDNANRYSQTAKTTLAELIPQAKALGPGLEASRKFFAETTDPLKEQIRPFTRQVMPVLRHTAQGAGPLRDTVGNFGDALGSLNYGFNELAFNPGASKPGYLFYLPWLNHNINNNYYTEDGGGGYRRALLLLTCNSAWLADGFVETRPYLKTVQQVTDAPTSPEICPPGALDSPGGAGP